MLPYAFGSLSFPFPFLARLSLALTRTLSLSLTLSRTRLYARNFCSSSPLPLYRRVSLSLSLTLTLSVQQSCSSVLSFFLSHSLPLELDTLTYLELNIRCLLSWRRARNSCVGNANAETWLARVCVDARTSEHTAGRPWRRVGRGVILERRIKGYAETRLKNHDARIRACIASSRLHDLYSPHRLASPGVVVSPRFKTTCRSSRFDDHGHTNTWKLFILRIAFRILRTNGRIARCKLLGNRGFGHKSDDALNRLPRWFVESRHRLIIILAVTRATRLLHSPRTQCLVHASAYVLATRVCIDTTYAIPPLPQRGSHIAWS